ncbi:hypothetical protein UR09_03515 [Candidatus Nitromaritima sp. SCGC AAA799-A02]|nr:hypothetical protein UZ36_04790 [Candidatus Nitromaritima sp. SCGC AAA799-C22]KMP11381.1 hypothetical protein UR09_03515 [Candidatus Nitromaritima sp. SCGC AAA799-A02]
MIFAKLHPLLVHFPVGLLVSGALFELYGNLRGEKTVAEAGSFNVRFGFWCSLPVLVVGILGVMSIETRDEFKPFLARHILFAFSTVILFLGVVLLSRFRERTWGKAAYHIFLVMGLFAVLGTGFFGGELVHRFHLPTGPGS